MLRSLNRMRGYELRASDGAIGQCRDFLFDDRHWAVRYMVADTGKWLVGKKVLISPISFGEPDWAAEVFPVRLTKQQIEESPDLDEDAPVSRLYEELWHKHYAWPYYWAGPGVWGAGAYPAALFAQEVAEAERQDEDAKRPEESHLRSADEVQNYHIHATDGQVGHVEDFIVDEPVWLIRYLVVDTRNLLPGKRTLVSPNWIKQVDWAGREVVVNLSVDAVKNSPEYDPSMTVSREYEAELYDYHSLPTYWP